MCHMRYLAVLYHKGFRARALNLTPEPNIVQRELTCPPVLPR